MIKQYDPAESPSAKSYVDAFLTRRGRRALQENELRQDAPFTHEEVVKAGAKRVGKAVLIGALVGGFAGPPVAHEVGNILAGGAVQERAPVPDMTVATPGGPIVAPETTPAPAPTAAENVVNH